MEKKIEEKLKICKRNKRLGLFGVAIVLALSFVLVNKGTNKINSEKGILEKTIETKGLDNVQLNILKVPLDTSNCILPIEVETEPVIATEENYNNTANVLLCVSALMFIILALWGAFTFLFKVLKSEHEIKLKVLDVELKIYNEQQMWEITKQKNNHENSISKEKASSEKDEKDEKDVKENAEKYKEILKKMEMLKESVDFIKSKTSYDDKKILDSIKEYLRVVETKK